MDEAKITIIGAGVVGLAIAAELSRKYEGVVVLERHESFGKETSSRNSEVIHSGIYYPPGSLKAKLCVEGAGELYYYCESHSVPHKRIGKLIVAAESSEAGRLKELYDTGVTNGVKGLAFIEKAEIEKLEPAVNAVSALHSPDTGIVDSHSLMSSLYREAESSGAMFSFGSELNLIEKTPGGYVLGLAGEDYKFISEVVINSGGLASDKIAALAGIDVDTENYRLRYSKGSYFSYAKKSPVGRLIYPLPHKDLAGLGVHATLDLAGRLRFGPDTEDIEAIDYKVDAGKRDAFYTSATKIIRGLDRESFIPDMAGIRPKIKGTGIKDFVIRHEGDKGLEGFINLIGIESPGLTSCLSIAGYVKDIVNGILS